jgi:hypothetical protein
MADIWENLMPLLGSAFVIMWHDIAPEGEAEYHLWHTRQHMPERLGHSGFLRSRRGVNWGADHQRYFTLYEGEALETFTGEDYLRSLNGPTEWTKKVAPYFRNFLRMSCEVGASIGQGIGGALATFRCSLGVGASAASIEAGLKANLETLCSGGLIVGAHYGFARPEFSGGRTRETELRPEMDEPPFDLVVVIEGVGLAEVDREADAISAGLRRIGCGTVLAQSYDVAFLLDKQLDRPRMEERNG